MSLSGLPPLPNALSAIEILQQQLLAKQQSQEHMQIFQQNNLTSFDSQRSLTSSSSSSMSRKTTTLDTKLAILKSEMYSLRQLDLSLLSQLWALNESIQEFRAVMQEQETLSPHSPSNSDSNINSDEETSEDRNNNLLDKTSPASNDRDFVSHENDFIEDMHKKLEKQIKRMNVAPPPVPDSPRPV
jgi:chromosome segregation ATPase